MDESITGPTEADYRAADEVIARFGAIHPPSEGARERLAAHCHVDGESYFRLMWGLRAPTSFREELILRRIAGVITEKQLGQIIRQQSDKYLTEEVLNERYRELEQELSIYADFMQHCFRVVHERYRPFVEIDCDENVDRLCSKLSEKSRFSTVELEFLHRFIAEARIHYQAIAVQIPNFPAASYATALVLINGTWKRSWEDHKQNRPMAPLLGFCKPCLEILPRPQDISAMLEQEFAMARMYLQHRGSIKSSAQSITANQVTVNVNATEFTLNATSGTPTDDRKARQPAPQLKVNHWSELAIGIDAKGFWGLVPAPEFGGRFLKNKAIRLPLVGARWRPLFELLANSPDGETVSRIDLVLAFNLAPTSFDVPADFDALDPDDLEALKTQMGTTYTRLNGVLTELRERLRDFVNGPKGKGKTCLESVGDDVRAGFRTAYSLDHEDPGHYQFGERR